MKTGVLLNLSLALHLVGLSMSIGVTLTKYLSFKSWSVDYSKRATSLAAARKLNKFLGIGMGLAIISGILMMNLAYSAFMYQLWFQVKIIFLLLIMVLGIFSMKNESKLAKRVTDETNTDTTILNLVKHSKLLSGLQLGLFIAIIFLASFRFV
jgi:hypothetical protein